MACNDCSRAETCPPCVNESLILKDGETLTEALDRDAQEPPMSSEEEEEAAAKALKDFYGDEKAPLPDGVTPEGEPPPPQPERRPPYAVAYSVGGHLYELHVPGDAAVEAVDGALIIQHHLGPVVGIVRVLPVIDKESDAT